jgi:hypothetical protein
MTEENKVPSISIQLTNELKKTLQGMFTLSLSDEFFEVPKNCKGRFTYPLKN